MSHAGDQFDWSRCLSYRMDSDIGMRRANNQDSGAISLASSMAQWQREGHLFMVADGMGAHAAGELASKLAADNVVHLYRKHAGTSPPETLERAVREANEEINRRGQENLDFYNMGTTCSVLLLLPQGALVAHVGDSRVYRLRNQRLHQLTFDHSLVWELREAGQITASDSAPGIPKNVITRSLGPHPTVRVDLEGPFPLEVGDTFLVCSDGLTGCVSDGEIAAILAWFEPTDAAQLLTDVANLRGGPDNITVVVARVTGPEMASKNINAAPLHIGSERTAKPTVAPAYWIVSGVLLLAALVMLVAEQTWVASVLAGLGAVAVVATLLVKMEVFKSDGVRLSGGRKLGRGPYRHADVPAVEKFIGDLQRFLERNRTIAVGDDWPLDQRGWDATLQRAEQHVQNSELPAAAREYAQAVHLLMAAYRAHVKQRVPD